MRVTIGQINTTNGDLQGNTERILRAIDRAKADRADVVVLPEIAVQGYMSFDWFLDRDVARSALVPLDRIVEATEGLTAVVGTIRPTEPGPGGRSYTPPALSGNKKIMG